MNLKLLNEHIENGIVKKNKHPNLDLYILTYTAKAQYGYIWDDITTICRGLIVDKDYNIIQRPFKKFFNYQELNRLPLLDYKIYDKMDGSLGILYWNGNKPYISTKGSFSSDEAILGTKMLHDKYYNTFDKLDKSKTYLFEIVHPNNRIVVDYKGMEDLILIAVVDTETGYDEDIDNYSDLGFTMVEEFEHREVRDLIEDNISNKEGYILKFTNGFRVKIKFEEYVHNHKYITGISSYTIWEMLKNGESDEVILEVLPDEMYDWYNKVKAELTTQFNNIKNAVTGVYETRPNKTLTGKEFSDWAKTTDFEHFMYSLEKGVSINDKIWGRIKPDYEKPFSV